MVRKLNLVLIFVLITLFLCTFFVACDAPKETNRLDLSVDKDSENHEIQNRTIPDEHTHDFLDEWFSDEKYHWHGVCCGGEEIKDKEEHKFIDGLCKCGARENATEFLKFNLISGTVIGYNDDLPSNVAIPSEVEGVKITSIADGAFSGCENIVSVTIPSSVENIGQEAFSGCVRLVEVCNQSPLSISQGQYGINLSANVTKATSTNLRTTENGFVTREVNGEVELLRYVKPSSETSLQGENPILDIPSNITKIGNYAFYSTNLSTQDVSIGVPVSVKSIGHAAFSKSNFKGFEFANGSTLLTIDSFAFSKMGSLAGITIPNGVKELGAHIFEGCSNLTTISIPNSIENIGDNAFKDCNSLSYELDSSNNKYLGNETNNYLYLHEIANKNSATFVINSNTKCIANNVFNNCGNLTELTIPASVTKVGENAFYGCTSLEKINIPSLMDWLEISFSYLYSNPLLNDKAELYIGNNKITNISIPSTITEIKPYSLAGLHSLATINIPTSVTKIGEHAFNSCYNLTSINIPASVTSIGEKAFYNCYSIATMTVASTNTKYESPTNSNAIIEKSSKKLIAGCKNTIIPNDVESVAEAAFYGCDNLTNIAIPASVTSIGEKAFAGCSKLVEIYNLSNVNLAELDSFGNNKYGLVNIKNIYSTASGSMISTQGDFVIYSNGTIKEALRYIGSSTSATIPSGVTAIGAFAFNGVNSLNTLTIPTSVTSVGEGAFYNSNIQTVTVPTSLIVYLPTETIKIMIVNGGTSIGANAFSPFKLLEEIVIPNSITSIADNAFNSCKIKKATIPTVLANKLPKSDLEEVTMTGNGNLAASTFEGCGVLDTITISRNITTIGNNAFKGCISLTSVNLPNSITSIGNNAFENCAGLQEITIPGGVTSLGSYIFSNCAQLNSVTIGANVANIGSYAFKDCANLGSITLGQSVTIIGDYAFSGCYSLTNITIPSSVTSIGSNAFTNCRSITELTYNCAIASLGQNAFYNCRELQRINISSIEVWLNAQFANMYSNPLCNTHAELYLNNNKLANLTIPAGRSSISPLTFSGCRTLQTISLPASLTSIGERAFSGCKNLSSLTLPNGFTTLGNYSFEGCYNLESIIIPNSITTIGTTPFLNCYVTSVKTPTNALVCMPKDSVVNMEITNSITSITERLLSGFVVLKSVIIPSNITSIGNYAFENCTSLERLDVPNAPITNSGIVIPSGVTSLGEGAFLNCLKVRKMTLPDNLTTIGDRAFSGCAGLPNLTIPTSVTTAGSRILVDTSLMELKIATNIISSVKEDVKYITIYSGTSLAKDAFKNNGVIVELKITASGFTTIGESALESCSNLKTLYVPATLNKVSAYGFKNNALENIYFGGTSSQWNNMSTGFQWKYGTNFTVIYDSVIS